MAPARTKFMIATIFFLVTITAYLPLDIYVPALPIIAEDFSVSVSMAQWSITAFLFALAFGPLPCGIYSDKIGRKKVIVFSLVVLSVGSFMCAHANSIFLLCAARFVQGLGTSACISVTRSMLRDSLGEIDLARALAVIAIAIELGLAFSPLIGGIITDAFDWRSTFYFVLLLSLLMVAVIHFLFTESNENLNKDAFRLSVLKKNKMRLFTHRGFLSYSACGSLAFGAFIVYFSISPFVLEQRYGLSASMYGTFSTLVILPLVVGPIINVVLIKRYGLTNMLIAGALLSSTFSLLLLLGEILFTLPLATFLVLIAGVVMGLSFFFSNSIAGAMHHFKDIAGLSGSLYTTLQFLGAFAISSFVSASPFDGSVALAACFSATSISALLILVVGYRRIKI